MTKPNSPRLKAVLEDAHGIAFQRGSELVGTEHVLLALFYESEGMASQVMKDLGLTAASMLGAVDKVIPPQPPMCMHCNGT